MSPTLVATTGRLLNGAQAFVTNGTGLKRVKELDVLVLEDYVEGRSKC